MIADFGNHRGTMNRPNGDEWQAQADVVIVQLIWENQMTTIADKIHRLYPQLFSVK
jgi:hypothetical protein